jgi:serine/threonine protein phosphatase 1
MFEMEKRALSIFAIGDIHGCINNLELLFSKLPVTTKDHLVFLGDYIDRGPSSKEVVEFIIDLQQKYPTTCLRGNHEDMMLDYPEDQDVWICSGGYKTWESYGLLDTLKLPKSHVEFYENLEPIKIIDDYLFVHAGIDTGAVFGGKLTCLQLPEKIFIKHK